MDIASLTMDVKNQVKNTLEKAQKKKEHFETSNKKLKDFIQKIRDFLMGIVMFDVPAGEVAHTRLDFFFASVVVSRGRSRPSQH